MEANLLSIKSHQRLIGLATLSLPFMLLLGVWLNLRTDDQFQATMSEYVYTASEGIFIGTIFAVGVMLFCYVGYEGKAGKSPFTDNQLANIAGAAALITALFPTAHCRTGINQFDGMAIANGLHFFGALILFWSMAGFCLLHFPLSDQDEMSKQKYRRNMIYKFSGYGIITGIMSLGAIKYFSPGIICNPQFGYPVFWIEAAMTVLFSIAWLTKSELFFADEKAAETQATKNPA